MLTLTGANGVQQEVLVDAPAHILTTNAVAQMHLGHYRIAVT